MTPMHRDGCYFGGMRTVLSFGLVLFWAAISRGQVLFEHTFRSNVPCHADQLVRLPDGDLMIAGVMDTSLFIARATTAGDTLWTRDLPYHALQITEMVLIDDSTLMLACPRLVLVPLDGSWVQEMSVYAMDIGVLAPDTFLTCYSDHVQAGTISGDTLWTFLAPTNNAGMNYGVDNVLPLNNGNTLVLGRKPLDDDPWNLSVPWLARLDPEGNLIDSLSLSSVAVSPLVRGWDLRRTIDGGFVGSVWRSTADVLAVRGNAQGDTLWTRRVGYDQFAWEGDYFTAPHATFDRPSGNIILMGEGRMSAFTAALLELNADGEPQCLYFQPRDTLNSPEQYEFFRNQFMDGLVTEDDQVIGLASYGYSYFGGIPSDSAHWGLVGFADACFLPLALGATTMSDASIHVIPQPCTESMVVQTPVSVDGFLIDALGRVASHVRLSAGSNEVDVRCCSPGSYVMVLRSAAGGTFTRHISIQR